MSLKKDIDLSNLPTHITVIMDGNGRWAMKQGSIRIFGHQSAVKSVREISEGCAELGVKYLTLYAFSTENWNRPKSEVDNLMALLVETIKDEIDTLTKNNIRLSTIGDTSSLPQKCQDSLEEAMKITANNDRLNLILALNYSGRWDIIEATKKIAEDVQKNNLFTKDINENTFEDYLSTKGIPNPELMIRTSGEMRISNFLLWQHAYTEFYFTDLLWPDFRKEHLHEAIVAYQQRERRFGMTSEQVNS